MRERFFGLRLHEVAVLLAGVLVAFYAAWVIRDVGGATVGEPESRPAATSPPRPSAPPPLGAFRRAAAKARTVLVIGDSTGAGPGAWVDLVARDLGKTRRVTLHQWDDSAGQFAAFPTRYGDGRRLSIWNLSYPGVDATYPRRLTKVPDKPGAVVVNLGRDRTPRSLARTVRATTVAAEKRWGSVPTAWVLQNPSMGAEAGRQTDAIARLTSLGTQQRMPVIDVHAAFRETGRVPSLLDVENRPNGDGARLWAEVVARALRPRGE